MAAHDFANGYEGTLKLPPVDTSPQHSGAVTPAIRSGILVFSGGQRPAYNPSPKH